MFNNGDSTYLTAIVTSHFCQNFAEMIELDNDNWYDIMDTDVHDRTIEFLRDHFFLARIDDQFIFYSRRRFWLIEIYELTGINIVFDRQSMSTERFIALVSSRIIQESGEEEVETHSKDFAISKNVRKDGNRLNKKAKLEKKLADTIGKNVGSKSGKNVRSLKKKLKYEPHAGDEEGTFDFFSGSISFENLEKMMDIGERLLRQHIIMHKTSNMMALLLSALNFVAPGSMLRYVAVQLKKLIAGEKIMTMNVDDFRELLDLALTRWDSFKNNKYAQSFISVMGMALATLLCPTMTIHMTYDKFVMMTEKVRYYFFKADILGGLLAAVTYITNIISVYAHTGKFSGIYVTEETVEALTDRFIALKAGFEMYERGDLEFVMKSSQYTFLHELDSFITDCKDAKPALLGFQAKTIGDFIVKATGMKSMSNTIEAHRTTRMAPFSFMLFSGSGTNKSLLMKALTVGILAANGFEWGNDYLYFRNDTDKYTSGWKNHTTAILDDDVANSRPEMQKTDNSNYLLKCINNQPQNLVGAALDDKGTQFNRCLVYASTTNNPTQNLWAFTAFSSTQERRILYKILVEVKPGKTALNIDGTASSMIDYSRQTPEELKQLVPDVWYYTIYEAEIVSAEMELKLEFTDPIPDVKDNPWRWKIVEHNGVWYEKVGKKLFFEFMIGASKRHYAVQRRVVATDEAISKQKLCKGCGTLEMLCFCRPVVETVDSEDESGSGSDSEEESDGDSETDSEADSTDSGSNDTPPAPEPKPRKNPHRGVDVQPFPEMFFDFEPGPAAIYTSPHERYYGSLNAPVLDVAEHGANELEEDDGLGETVDDGEGDTIEDDDSQDLESLGTTVDDLQPESGRTMFEIWYMKRGIQQLRAMEDIGSRSKLLHAVNMLRLGKQTATQALAVVEAYFDKWMAKILIICVLRIRKSVVNIVKNAGEMLPAQLEGTQLGLYVHSQRPTVQWLARADMAHTLIYNTCSTLVPNVVFETAKRMAQVHKMITSMGTRYVLPKLKDITLSKWTLSYLASVDWTAPYRTLQKTGFAPKQPLGIEFDTTPRKFEVKVGATSLYLKARRFKGPKLTNVRGFISDMTTNSAGLISQELRDEKLLYPNWLRDQGATYAFFAYVGYALIPAFIGKAKNIYNLQELEQESLDQSAEEVRERDKLEEDPAFVRRADLILDQVPITARVAHQELHHIIKNNVFYVVSETGKCSQALGICTNVVLLPAHFVHGSFEKEFTFTRKPRPIANAPVNAQFRCILDSANVIFDEKKDLAFARVMSTGSIKDIRNYFPVHNVSSISMCTVHYRANTGILKEIPGANVKYNPLVTNNHLDKKIGFEGYEYQANTFLGLCGAPLIDASRKHAHILGIHCGGVPDELLSVAVLVNAETVQYHVSALIKGPVIQQQGFNVSAYGVELFQPGYHVKSSILHIGDELGNLRLLGRISKRASTIARIVQTPIARRLREELKMDMKWGPPPVFGPTGKDKKYAYRRILEKFANKRNRIPPKAVRMAKLNYLEDIMGLLERDVTRWKKEIRPLTDEEMVQGCDGENFVNGMNMSTSIGKHLGGPKKKYATQDPGGKWHFNEQILKDFRERWDEMSKAKRTWECVSAMPKVEPTSQERFEKGKSRIFFGTDTGTQLIMRKLWLRLTRLFCTQTETTECAVGLNATGRRWSAIVEWLQEMTGQNFVALDFVNYDIGMDVEVLDAAFEIIIAISVWSGNFTQEMINVMYVLREELINNIIDCNGDLVQMIGVILSGLNLTSILGSICNSIYLRIAVFNIYPQDHRIWRKGKFRELFKILTYGDDMIGKVHPCLKKINVTTLIESLGSFGIQATNCYKSAEKITYMKLHELEFLKRSFRYDKDFGTYVAPLNELSILKSLSAIIPPRSSTVSHVLVQNAKSALYEYQFHGRKHYEKMRAILTKVLAEQSLTIAVPTLQLSFDDVLQAWKDKYALKVTEEEEKPGLKELRRWVHSNLSWHQTNWSIWTPESQEIFITEDELHMNNKAVEMEVLIPDAGVALPSGTMEELNGVIAESGDIATSDANMAFHDEEKTEYVTSGSSVTCKRVTDPKMDIQSFLARPIKLHNFVWDGDLFTKFFNPWSEFLSNKRVANKIAGYKLFRGKCHVKFLINGNGFYYGKVMAFYRPLAVYDTMTESAFDGPRLITLSQMDHVFIDPTLSTGAEMDLSFLWHYDYIDLTATDKNNLGSISMVSINKLKNVSATITPATALSITVYAWMTDIELEGPTATNPLSIVPQSGEEPQVVTKPISQTATLLANVFGAIGRIPILEAYSMPLEKAMHVGSALASFFGYSRPRIVEEPRVVAVTGNESMCVTNTTCAAKKLTVDCKQGLAFDGKSLGARPQDELSIAFIAGVESYYDTVTWATTAAPDDLLYNLRVHPYALYQDAFDPPGVRLTAIAGASMPFEYWTGTIEYRFSIVCSAFHRGRLAFHYDSNGCPPVGTHEANMGYVEVVDISETRDFVIKISNHQKSAWLNTGTLFGSYPLGSSAGPLSSIEGITNGNLSVWVVNKLAVAAIDPAVNTDIAVNVFIRAGSDFQVAQTGSKTRDLVVIPESGVADNIDDTGEGSPITAAHVNPVPNDDSKMYMGEIIGSFRALLKRYTYWTSVGGASGTTYAHIIRMYPYYRGPNAGGMHVSSTGNYNYAQDGFINFLRSAYLVTKGSMRYKVIREFSGSSAKVAVTKVQFQPPQVYSVLPVPVVSSVSNINIYNTTTQGINPMHMQGTELNQTYVSGVLDFEVPFYSRYKFIPGRHASMHGLINPPSFAFYTGLVNATTIDAIYVSAGEDFTLAQFVGWPLLEYRPIDPAP